MSAKTHQEYKMCLKIYLIQCKRKLYKYIQVVGIFKKEMKQYCTYDYVNTNRIERLPKHHLMNMHNPVPSDINMQKVVIIKTHSYMIDSDFLDKNIIR